MNWRYPNYIFINRIVNTIDNFIFLLPDDDVDDDDEDDDEVNDDLVFLRFLYK